MTPRILDYEQGRILVTVNAYCIPEIKAILDKYDMKAEPYLAYVHLMTSPDSPYINYEEEDKKETIIYDVINTVGDFDIDEPLLIPALEKLTTIFTSRSKKYYDAICVLMDKVTEYSKKTTVVEGKDGNLGDVNRMIKEAGSTIRSFKDVEKQVDEELKTKMRGKNVLGDY